MKVSKMIELLQEHYSPEEEVVGNIWNISDVYYACEMFDFEKPDKEIAEKILIYIDDNLDANDGISWDTFRDALEEFEIPEKEEEN